jgi:hypothetical protein
MKVVTRLLLLSTVVIGVITSDVNGEKVQVSVDRHAAPRVVYGANRLIDALNSIGFQGSIVNFAPSTGKRIDIQRVDDGKPEGFSINSLPDDTIQITSVDDSGLLYGCLELAHRVSTLKKFPLNLHFSDGPAFKLRGPCIGMQKTYILPGRHVYEYPYTPELFPFFYDKQFWTEYLDFLADNRMNTLYLWSGHPFASLVKLPDYPYALEVPEDVFNKNVEMFRWITSEADKRGIWVVQMFYNILLSKPFAEHNGMATQLAAPNPLAADYTRKSIAEFVKQYPNVGLMTCLGEALSGNENQKEWLCDVILPGIHDGMKEAGITTEPPVVIRDHATDLRLYMADALKIYKNIYTEAKFNGESLTTWEPRGKRQQAALDLSHLGSTHVMNVHVLANLEPFRYGDVDFIKKCVQAGRDRLGAKGLHLFPLFYWNWPDSPDAVDPPLKQWRRDWIWFEAWARYSWNPDIDAATDHAYWIGRLASMYGTDQAAEKILAAYDDSGECAPRILRRFGITEGNRQTMSLGMTLDELVNPNKYNAFDELWLSQSPPGERLQEYVDKEWNHQPHEGETPPQIIKEILEFSKKAVEEIDAAEPSVTENKDEYHRLQNDVHCIRAMSQFYAAKANAAILVLRYAHSHDLADMKNAAIYLAESVEHYRALVTLTENTYRYANSMQTSQRRIPLVGGVGGKPANYLWSQILPVYEKELTDFQKKIDSGGEQTIEIKPLAKASITLISKNAETYDVKVGEKVFTDQDDSIEALAPELNGLTGIRFKSGKYEPVEFETKEPVNVLVGYVQSQDPAWLQPPNLETDARAAERGDIDPLIQNAATISHLPAINIYAMKFDAGRHTLDLHGDGSFIVLGVIPQSAQVARRDAHLAGH